MSTGRQSGSICAARCKLAMVESFMASANPVVQQGWPVWREWVSV